MDDRAYRLINDGRVVGPKGTKHNDYSTKHNEKGQLSTMTRIRHTWNGSKCNKVPNGCSASNTVLTSIG